MAKFDRPRLLMSVVYVYECVKLRYLVVGDNVKKLTEWLFVLKAGGLVEPYFGKMKNPYPGRV